MKKYFFGLALLLSLFLTSQLYAAGNEAYVSRDIFVEDVLASNDNNVMAIPSGQVVYTKSFDIGKTEYNGFQFYASSDSSAPSLKIECEQSTARPTTEGAADTFYSVPENAADVESNLTAETVVHKSWSMNPFKYGRLKITGSGTNPADTKIQIKLSKEICG